MKSFDQGHILKQRQGPLRNNNCSHLQCTQIIIIYFNLTLKKIQNKSVSSVHIKGDLGANPLRGVCQKIFIKPPKEANLGLVQLF